MNEMKRQDPSWKPFLAFTSLVAATLGAGEIVLTLHRLPRIEVLDFALLFLYGCMGYIVCATAVAVIFFFIVRKHLVINLTNSWAIAIAFATFSSIRFLWSLVNLGHPALAWLIPGCFLMGTVCGAIAGWLSRKSAILQEATFWRIANTLFLWMGLIEAAHKNDERVLWWYTALLCAVVFLVWFGRHVRGSKGKSVRLSKIYNSGLFAAVLLAPAVVSSFNSLNLMRPTRSKIAKARPNIILISVDTLRRDRLGCYGYSAAHTPHIDSLATQSILFEDATTPIAFTGPAHTSMLTGLYPMHHGVKMNGVGMPKTVITLPDLLSQNGYQTAAFISGWPLKDVVLNLGKRFGVYNDNFSKWKFFPDTMQQLIIIKLLYRTLRVLTGMDYIPSERAGEYTTEKAIAWLSKHAEGPFFLFVHYFDPHGPHVIPPTNDPKNDPYYATGAPVFRRSQPMEVRRKILENPQRVVHIKQLYDKEISYTDNQIGRLLDALKTLDLMKNTYVIFTADHGESLDEHGYYFNHGEYLYDNVIRVPLLLRIPEARYKGIRVSNQVRLVDVTPTVLDAANIQTNLDLDGRSLLSIVHGKETAERVSLGAVEDIWSTSTARYYVRQKGYELIWDLNIPRVGENPVYEQLFDLTKDPDELHNLTDRDLPILPELRNRMRQWVQGDTLRIPSPDPEIREQLHAIGYL